MAWGLIQQTVDYDSASPNAVALPAAVTAGNDLFLAVGLYEGGNRIPASVVDNRGNSWSMEGVTTDQRSGRLSLWRARAVAGGATTVTVTHSSGYPHATLWEFAGAGDRDLLIVADAANSHPIIGPSAATSTAESVAFALLGMNDFNPSVPNVTSPAGYSPIHAETNGYDFFGVNSAYRLLTAVGQQTADWGSLSNYDPGDWAALLAVYKRAGGALPPMSPGSIAPTAALGAPTFGRGAAPAIAVTAIALGAALGAPAVGRGVAPAIAPVGISAGAA
ncbi:hypothetical protein, partial [Plastoroseomonas hellenica]|uniref:hypothetical protein n=1 Tax=Plastoroseomonas hellenica TaxID=2687306 RepID=UPI001BADB354